MTKIHCRKRKRGHNDAEINLQEGLSESEKKNLIECLEPHHWIAKIINENTEKGNRNY